MGLLCVKWFGRRPSSRSNRYKVKEIINEYTSEHDEEYVVCGFMNESSSLTTNNYSSNVLFKFENRLYLAVFTDIFVLIFPDLVLNIAVLISLYDRREIRTYDEMSFNYDIRCFLT